MALGMPEFDRALKPCRPWVGAQDDASYRTATREGDAVMEDDGRGADRPGRSMHARSAGKLAAATLPLLLAATSCSPAVPVAPTLDPGKVASIVVGRSSRNDVFAALGRPARTERSSLGEVWVYQPTADSGTGGSGLMSGASAASRILGAFVPYAGAVGSGLGLAGTAMGGSSSTPSADSLSVTFRDGGIVRDCTFSSTMFPAAGPGPAVIPAKVVDCQRPGSGDAASS